MGLHFYEKAKRNATTREEMHREIDNIVKEEHAAIDKAHPKHLPGELIDPSKETSHKLINAAKYAAVALGGLAAGLIASRHFSRYFEFAADRHGAQMVSPEAMASGLKKVHALMPGAISQRRSGIMKLLAETILAHPSLDERLANIAKMGR